MLTYNGLNEDPMYFDNIPDWSLIKTTKLLSNESVPSSTDIYGYTDQEIDHIYDTPPMTKNELLLEMLPVDTSYNEWQSKFIDQWTPQDCLLWLIYELQDLKVVHPLTEVKMEQIAHMSGTDLKEMNIQSFNEMFPGYGSDLYYRLQKFKVRYNNYFTYDQWNSSSMRTEENCITRYMPPSQPLEPTTLTDLDMDTTHTASFTSRPAREPFYLISEGETDKSNSSMEASKAEPQPAVPEKRRPGRPRGTRKKKKPEKLGRLWEFIRDLLLNPQYNPSMICWENYDEGMFRFVHSDRVAKLWGSKKENEDMNYEKLSRAMRYYYKSQVLLPVYGKRLVYKFGPTATGWRSDNPIMRCQG